MEKGFDEGSFVRDGRRSDVHCLWPKTSERIVTQAHYHNYVEVLYGVDCDMTVWVNDKTYTLKTGDIFVIRPNETHMIISNQKIADHIVVKFLPEILNCKAYDAKASLYLLPIMGKFAGYSHIIKKDIAEKWNVKQIFEEIVAEFENAAFAYELAIRQGILKLFTLIIRYWYDNGGKKMFDSVGERGFLIWQAAEFISENYMCITENEVAEKFSMSYSYFSRTFKKVMKMGFSEYVMRVRIENAAAMLLTTEMSVTNIAQETGFSTASHFISNFKKYHECSPLAYRNAFRKKYE